MISSERIEAFGDADGWAQASCWNRSPIYVCVQSKYQRDSIRCSRDPNSRLSLFYPRALHYSAILNVYNLPPWSTSPEPRRLLPSRSLVAESSLITTTLCRSPNTTRSWPRCSTPASVRAVSTNLTYTNPYPQQPVSINLESQFLLMLPCRSPHTSRRGCISRRDANHQRQTPSRRRPRRHWSHYCSGPWSGRRHQSWHICRHQIRQSHLPAMQLLPSWQGTALHQEHESPPP